MSELRRRLAPDLPHGRHRAGPVQVLDLANRIIAGRESWRPEWQAHDTHGGQCGMLQRRARYFSCEGAICRAHDEMAAGWMVLLSSLRIFRETVGVGEHDSSGIKQWERAPERTAAEVCAAFAAALERARSEDETARSLYGVDIAA